MTCVMSSITTRIELMRFAAVYGGFPCTPFFLDIRVAREACRSLFDIRVAAKRVARCLT